MLSETPGNRMAEGLERTAVSTEAILARVALTVLIDDDPARIPTVAVVVVLAPRAATLELLVGSTYCHTHSSHSTPLYLYPGHGLKALT